MENEEEFSRKKCSEVFLDGTPKKLKSPRKIY